MGEKKESEALNLWSSLLKESSKRVKAPDATCIILGDYDSGKSTLLSKLGGESILGAEVNSSIIKEILLYTFIDVDEEFFDSDSVSRINLWSISDKTFTGCIENVIKPGESERVSSLRKFI
jgi:GTPase SAR1 family protein